METWQAPGHPLVVEYSALVMEELRQAAEEGFQRIGHGGLEVGGVLFGTREVGSVSIEDWRVLECEHARGPSFVLSDNDEAGLARLLEDARTDPELKDLAPVGWYHTHTRTGILLSLADQEIHDRHFPEPWQVALVLHPVKGQAMLGGFFVRGSDGTIRGDGSPTEFTVNANAQLPVRSGKKPVPAAEVRKPSLPAPVRTRPPQPALTEIPVSVPPTRPSMIPTAPEPAPAVVVESRAMPAAKPARASHRREILAILGLILSLAGAAAVTQPYWRRMTLPGRSSEALALRIHETEGQMQVSWDRNSAPVREAVLGRVRISDSGSLREIELTSGEVRTGSLTYVRESEDVEVRLTVERAGKPEVHEIARFLGPPAPRRLEAQLEEAEQQRTRMENESKKLRTELRRESVRSRQLRDSIRILEDRLRADENTAASPRQ